MAKRTINRSGRFLERFELEERWLQPPDPEAGRPGIIEAVDKETGESVLVKQWASGSKTQNKELKELWRHEVRQLHRLAGYPGAREYIVPLRDSGEDKSGFFLVLSPSRRVPLQVILDDANSQHWLSAPKIDRNRLRIWQELKRTAAGIDILHAQGILHRNLDKWSVYTSVGDEPDFQLSGFEWTIRLGSASISYAPSSKRIKNPNKENTYSFLHDWVAFGRLAADLLSVDEWALLTDQKVKAIARTADHLLGAERELLRILLRGDPLERLDGEIISQRIEAIILALGSVVARKELRLYLSCNVGRGSRLSEAVRAASGRTIDILDRDRQLAFIRDDLSEEKILLAIRGMEEPLAPPRLILVGRSLVYRLSPLSVSRNSGGGDTRWDLAFCENVAPQRPAQQAIVSERDLSGIPLEILSDQESTRRMVLLQGKTARWNDFITKVTGSDTSDATAQHRALVLLQLLEASVMAASIWPVTVCSERTQGDRCELRLVRRFDHERDKLSAALSLKPIATRMRDAFRVDQATDRDWKVTDIGVLGEPDRETARWRFVDIENDTEDQEPIYVFEGSGPAPIGDTFFLREGDYIGKDRLLRRRVRALRALREHTELLATLSDPRISIRPTHDDLNEDTAFAELDPSKQKALTELWNVLPLYLVQGPPGVGKTRLVREAVSRRFVDDPAARILLTAQSHSAVDHLMDEVQKALSCLITDSPPLVVRSRPKDSDAKVGQFDLREQARVVINSLCGSELYAIAPKFLKDRIKNLQSGLTKDSPNEDVEPNKGAKPDRAFEGLLLRAANIVFASTNSGDLEQLIDERAQFDWSIMEEAGKATGVELVAPLLLAHRSLMIGDHKQLPPFGADEIKKVLASPDKVHEALEIGRPMVSRPFRAAGMDDVVDDLDADSTAMTRLCGEAASSLMLFETMVERELATRRGSGLAIATRLSYQHRMHPAIAKLVSDAFYKRELQNDPEREAAFLNGKPPFFSSAKSRLPASPIVFIDMPYVQTSIGKSYIEKQPRFHNPDEVKIVIEALSLLECDPESEKPPTLAVLAPYRQQVKRLGDRINQEKNRLLKNLEKFAPASTDGSFVGTVDSFQGSEADVIVISLVRNNQHSGRRALGFLSDPRRMNVLFSRAKWQLIIVGSKEFLEKRFSPGEITSKDDALYFLRELLKTFSELESTASKDGDMMAVTWPVSRILMVGK